MSEFENDTESDIYRDRGPYSAFSALAATSAAITVAVVLGCGDGRPETVPVSGTVIYQGEPVAEASVMFYPEDNRPAMGKSDAEGRFRLMTFEPDDGAVIGRHRVAVTKNVGGPVVKENPYPEFTNVLPKKFAVPSKSGLTADVTGDGDNDFELRLTD